MNPEADLDALRLGQANMVAALRALVVALTPTSVTFAATQGTSPWIMTAVDASGSIEEASRRSLRIWETANLWLDASHVASTNHYQFPDGVRIAATDHSS